MDRSPSIIEALPQEEGETTGGGPTYSGLQMFVGNWRGGTVAGRDEFLKVAELGFLCFIKAVCISSFDGWLRARTCSQQEAMCHLRVVTKEDAS